MGMLKVFFTALSLYRFAYSVISTRTILTKALSTNTYFSHLLYANFVFFSSRHSQFSCQRDHGSGKTSVSYTISTTTLFSGTAIIESHPASIHNISNYLITLFPVFLLKNTKTPNLLFNQILHCAAQNPGKAVYCVRTCFINVFVSLFIHLN